MSSRLSRAEQNDRNRALLLAAARRVFLDGATTPQPWSRSPTRRGSPRAWCTRASPARPTCSWPCSRTGSPSGPRRTPDLARQLAGSGDFAALLDLAQRAERGAPGWRLLVTEFRVHAARDPELNRRYAALHARTVGRDRGGPRLGQRGGRRRPAVPAPAAGRAHAGHRGRHRAGAAGQPGRPRRSGPAGARQAEQLVRAGTRAHPGGNMTTTMTTDLDLLRTRIAGAMAGQLPGHIERLGWAPGSSPPSSVTGCGRCWPGPSSARPSTPGACAASTPAGSSSPTCPGCRS